jgi:hypothetical protein
MWRPGFRIAVAFAALAVWAVRQFLTPRIVGHPGRTVAGAALGSATHRTTDFERTDWPLAPVGLVFLGSLALLVISCLVLIAAYPTSLPDVSRDLRISPPGPRLQTDPQRDLARFHADEARRLNTYYWIDRQKGIVHIPIEQAMHKLATTGVQGFPRGQP